MTEDELANQIRQYQDLKKDNKNVDIAALALTALSAHANNMLTPKEKRVAYLISLALPPFGLLYAVKFYVSGKDDGKTAAYLCLGLTAAAILLLVITTNLMFSSSGVTVDQLKQTPQQYRDLIQ